MPPHAEAEPDVIGIYRARNGGRLLDLLQRGAPPTPRWRLWALDEVVPALAPWTLGHGSGGKFALLNELIGALPPADSRPLIVVDDDIRLRRGDLYSLCHLMAAADLGLAQPAHSRGSQSSYTFNRRALGARARTTTFVEIGPVFAISAGWRHAFTPFPADVGMGWGLELIWQRQQERGCRFGVVDTVTVEHPDYPTAGYAQAEEERRVQALMKDAGISTMAEAQQVLQTWWCWQRRPPWTRGVPQAAR